MGAVQRLRGQLLIAGLRKGAIKDASAAPTPASDVFSPRFEWTEREREILGGLLAGRTNRQIAKDFFLSHQTVKNYVSRIYKKIGVTNRLELLNIARPPARDNIKASPDGRI